MMVLFHSYYIYIYVLFCGIIMVIFNMIIIVIIDMILVVMEP